MKRVENLINEYYKQKVYFQMVTLIIKKAKNNFYNIKKKFVCKL